MNAVASEIAARFEEAGWRVDVAGNIGELDAVAVKPYAIAGISVLSGPDALAETWLKKQADLEDFQSAARVNRLADAYLLLVVDEIPDSLASAASAVASDTTVCRKLIVELRGRPAREALDDTPLLPLSGLDARDTQGLSTGGRSDGGLPEEILVRLAKEGADRILDDLIGGEPDEA